MYEWESFYVCFVVVVGIRERRERGCVYVVTDLNEEETIFWILI